MNDDRTPAPTRTIIVADTGPLIALARIEHLELLTRLFREVLVPQRVREESCRDLQRPGARILHDSFARNLLQVVDEPPEVPGLLFPRALGPGERAAIHLALDRHLGLLLDDRPARRFAQSLELPVLGTGGLLLLAKGQGLIDHIAPRLHHLRSEGYRLSAALVEQLLPLAGESPEAEEPAE